MTLIVAHVEGVPCQVLLLPVEVLDHRQGIIVRTLLHILCVGVLLDSASEAALVLYLAR